MGRRHLEPEQIIHMLREAEIKLAGRKTTGEVCRALGISERWACGVWRQPRSTEPHTIVVCDDEDAA